MMHLRYCLTEAFDNGVKDHAQITMCKLGIKYQIATPQSIADQWWFWCCENVPHVLPPYLTELGLNPVEAIGFGLSEEDCLFIQREMMK